MDTASKPPIITLKEARAAGLDRYFTGKLCKHGHLSDRDTKSKRCFECRRTESLTYRTIHSEKRKAEVRRYLDSHREQIAVQHREQYAANPERFNAASEKWRAENRDKVNAAKARRRKSDPEKARAQDKRNRELGREKILQRLRNWKERNRDHVRAYDRQISGVKNHARRARKMNAEGTYTDADIINLLLAQNGLCAAPHCKRDITVRFTIDHKVPLSRDGSNWPANLQLLCKSCNCKKGSRTMDEWLAS
jgi:5-methylcytosine-specific restriction endonuclease McrA